MMLKHTALPTERGGVCETERRAALMNQEVWVAANPKIGTTKEQKKIQHQHNPYVIAKSLNSFI